ncbi:Pyroglutamylated RFamide peptide receptor [Exaiptasia diaphana]|nr:Pyroglutamylated RFamide peptide receptor [Exaiptasia diaphana]
MGNGLVLAIIAIVRRSGFKSTVQLFIVHLAISDLFVCILCIPMTIFSNFHYPINDGIGGIVLCKIVRFVQFVAPTISISILTVISIDRWLSIARPILSKAPRMCMFRPFWLITFAWLFSTLQFLPTFYFSTLVPINISNTTVFYCTPIPNKSLPGKLFLMIIFLASFVFPVSAMGVLYTCVARAVWNRGDDLSMKTQHDNTSKYMQDSKKKVTRTLLIVVAVFLICWTPFVVYTGFLEDRLKGFPNPMDAVRLGLYGLGLFNSVCNPFIYYFNGVNLNPRVLIENERKRRSSSVSPTLYISRMNSIKSARRSTSYSSAKDEPLGSKRNAFNSTCPSMSPDDDVVFIFTPDDERTTYKVTHV